MHTGCGSSTHLNRRTLLKMAGAAGACWLTPLAECLARQADAEPGPKSVILLWMQGGPSQLDTFDPHPGTMIGGDVTAIPTRLPGVQIASTMPRVADLMDRIALVRSVTSKEGDHERATYNIKTGFRPDPTLVHPSLGAIVCHQLSDNVEIPRHVSILPTPWPSRGGFLGDRFDAFKVGDPQGPVPDVTARVPEPRMKRRVDDLLNVVEQEFARGRLGDLDQGKTLHAHSIRGALRMMSSEQLQAFDVAQESASLQAEFGDSPFGRGCLAAIRLIDVGVRCVEVTLNGWDSHVNNHEIQAELAGVLDAALSALIRELERRQLLQNTIVLCGGEFGRTPRINPAGGRDHWPHGFSIALAGGGIRAGQVIGATAPQPKLDEEDHLQDVQRPHNIADIHATVLHALGIDFSQEIDTPVGRPMALSQGTVITDLLA